MKIIKLVLKLVLSLILLAVLLVGVLTVFEYKPEDVEVLDIKDNQTDLVQLDQSMTFMSFNIGYAGLGKDEDFVMDGGKKGRPDSKEVVEAYLEGIQTALSDYPSDFYLLQEVDIQSRRSYRINELELIQEGLGSSYSSQFAYNFKALFVPFPLSLTDYIGYVESGITTYTTYHAETSTRYQFPGAFSWPLRVANLKRAMMVTYLDIEGSTKKLVVVNLHMSAYDGDGSLRAQEMEFLKTFMEEEYALGNYVIVGGDFNQTFPEAEGVYDVQEGFYVAYPMASDFLPSGYSFEVDITSPTNRLLNQPYDSSDQGTQYYIIDGFIVSDNILVEKYEVSQDAAGAMTVDLDFEHSDHNPVVIKIKLIP